MRGCEGKGPELYAAVIRTQHSFMEEVECCVRVPFSFFLIFSFWKLVAQSAPLVATNCSPRAQELEGYGGQRCVVPRPSLSLKWPWEGSHVILLLYSPYPPTATPSPPPPSPRASPHHHYPHHHCHQLHHCRTVTRLVLYGKPRLKPVHPFRLTQSVSFRLWHPQNYGREETGGCVWSVTENPSSGRDTPDERGEA